MLVVSLQVLVPQRLSVVPAVLVTAVLVAQGLLEPAAALRQTEQKTVLVVATTVLALVLAFAPAAAAAAVVAVAAQQGCT